ncbi:putative triacylglycerol lipase [Leptospira ryugenii]|uniref:Putative triacylglycerol lipase n=1 Tax=Leptospira ryugenii TaxID=1917863 RepID=A0A2P2DZJ1_9LEPT|nr:alpha/beta hydrolase [Leptospira ryugenii]GBF50048.1 putative triacylglycerol lipase [Leptospira ryugenii]
MLGIKRSLAQFALSIPENWVQTVFGTVTESSGQVLNPQCQLLCNFARILPKLESLPPSKARKLYLENTKMLQTDPIPVAHLEDKLIPTPSASFIPLRIYNANPQKGNQGIILYIHGGGFTIGSIETHDEFCRRLSYFSQSIVAAVDYRLAPEHPYPAALEDCFQAYQYIRNVAYLMGGSPDKIAVAGDSAGGLLSIALALRAKKEKTPLPAFLGLLYPMTDCSRESSTYEEFSENFVLTRATMRWFIQNYIPEVADRSLPYHSPLLLEAKDVKGFPATYLATAGFDPLREEGDQFAELLLAAGQKVSHRHFPNLIHGYVHYSHVSKAAEAAEMDFFQSLRNFFETRKI